MAILYSLMIALAATSVWLGRNQTLYEFWFYITNFSRYPMEIYRGTIGSPLRWVFTFIIPLLIVVNVPPPAPTSSPSINNSVTFVDADAVMNNLLDKCLFGSLLTLVAVTRVGKRRVSTAKPGSSYPQVTSDISE